MGRSVFTFLFLMGALFVAAGMSYGQDRPNEETPLFPRRSRQEDPPNGVRDMIVRMQIEKKKKDFEEMLDNGDQIAKLSGQIESSIEKTSALSTQDRDHLVELAKLTEEVLDDLGGDADDLLSEPSDKGLGETPLATAKELEAAAKAMVAELHKTTRFTVSASAIESTAEVLRLARKLRSYQ
ncbi:MAG: hypothetical protein K1X52_02815 [Pyrinomonadaceae bacterium]|nr:hypothetical protein [Pyrinomonadaceae bacterium]